MRPLFECQDRILNVKIRKSALVWMSKYDFNCQNTIFRLSSNVKIGFWHARLFVCACFVVTCWERAWLSIVVSTVSLSLSHWYPGSGVVLDCIDSWSLHPYLLWMSKYDMRSDIECQNSIFQCQNTTFGSILNVKIRYWMPKYDIGPQFECQNRILNVTIWYSSQVRMSK